MSSWLACCSTLPLQAAGNLVCKALGSDRGTRENYAIIECCTRSGMRTWTHTHTRTLHDCASGLLIPGPRNHKGRLPSIAVAP